MSARREGGHARSPLARILFAVAGVAVIAAVVVGLLAYRDLRAARSELSRSKDVLSSLTDDPSTLLTSSGRASDGAAIDEAMRLAGQARTTLNRSVALDVLSVVPLVGDQVRGARSLAADSVTAVRQARSLLDQFGSVAGSSHIAAGSIPMSGFDTMRTAVSGARSALSSLDRSTGGLWGTLRGDRQRFDGMIVAATGKLARAASLLDAIRSFVGGDGPRRYLLAAENNAQMRDGGMVLSVAELDFDNGHYSTSGAQAVADLPAISPVDLAVPAGMEQVFGVLGPTLYWMSTNATADFTWSAQALAALYLQTTGRSVDGVVAMDVPALAGILGVTGPITVPGLPETLTTDNAPGVLLHDLYSQSPTGDQAPRHEELSAVFQAVMAQLRSSGAGTIDIGRALQIAAAGGHVKIWSADSAQQNQFATAGLSGSPGSIDPDRTLHVAVENATATKLDYYIHPSVSVHVTITALGTALVKTDVTVDDQAPGGPPSEQLGPDGINTFEAGQYAARVYMWGPAGGVQLGSVAESGLRLSQQPLIVNAGASSSVSFSTAIPDAVVPAGSTGGRFSLRLVPQARLWNVPLSVSFDAPGWSVTGNRLFEPTWDSTLDLSWDLSPGPGVPVLAAYVSGSPGDIPYVGTVTTVPPTPTTVSGVRPGPPAGIGDAEACQYAPSSPVTLTSPGAAPRSTRADPRGCVTVHPGSSALTVIGSGQDGAALTTDFAAVPASGSHTAGARGGPVVGVVVFIAVCAAAAGGLQLTRWARRRQSATISSAQR